MFKLTYSLIQNEPRMPTEGEILPDINKFPILNQEEAHRIFEARFLKECGIFLLKIVSSLINFD